MFFEAFEKVLKERVETVLNIVIHMFLIFTGRPLELLYCMSPIKVPTLLSVLFVDAEDPL